MIKAEIKNGEVHAEIEGTKAIILADLTVFAKSIFENLEKETGIPKEIHQMAFLLGLKAM